MTGRWFRARPELHGVEAMVRADQASAFAYAFDWIGLVEAERKSAALDRFFRADARRAAAGRVGWRAVVLEQPDQEGGQG
jgi:hypothetical protein